MFRSQITMFRLFVVLSFGLLLRSGSVTALVLSNEDYTLSDTVGHCLRGGGAVLPCISSGGVNLLEAANERGGFEISDGVQLVQDNGQGARSLLPIDHNPGEFKTFLDAAAMFMEQRSLRYNMDYIYPGLLLRVGASNDGKGVVEFLMDNTKEADDRSLSTGRMIMKRTLLPILLGLKLNVVTILPLIFAGLILLVKKVLFISKFALLFTSLLGYNSLKDGSGYGHQYQPPIYNHHQVPLVHPPVYHSLDALQDNFYKSQEKYKDDVSRNTKEFQHGVRNFAWEEREKKKSL